MVTASGLGSQGARTEGFSPRARPEVNVPPRMGNSVKRLPRRSPRHGGFEVVEDAAATIAGLHLLAGLDFAEDLRAQAHIAAGAHFVSRLGQGQAPSHPRNPGGAIE